VRASPLFFQWKNRPQKAKTKLGLSLPEEARVSGQFIRAILIYCNFVAAGCGLRDCGNKFHLSETAAVTFSVEIAVEGG
jgi:hypothetical protein